MLQRPVNLLSTLILHGSLRWLGRIVTIPSSKGGLGVKLPQGACPKNSEQVA
jgi:hypothetical protein